MPLSAMRDDIASICQGKPRTLYSSLHKSITISLSVLEPVIFLPACPKYGEDITPPSYEDSNCNSCNTIAPQPVLRGSLVLKLSKPTSIRSVSLSLYGVSETQWPYYSPLDIGHNGSPYISKDSVVINRHEWHFAPNEQAAMDTIKLIKDSDQSSTVTTSDTYGADTVLFCNRTKVQNKNEYSIYNNASTNTITGSCIPLLEPRNDNFDDKSHDENHKKEKETIYPAGEYIYNFTIALGRNLPETVRTQFGSIRYFVEPKVVHKGFFGHSSSGKQEVELVRCPKSNIYNPLANSPCRIWKDFRSLFHYDIQLGSRYLTLGEKISLVIRHRPMFEQVRIGEVTIDIVQYIKYTNSYTKKKSSRCQLVQLARKKYPHQNMSETILSSDEALIDADVLPDTNSSSYMASKSNTNLSDSEVTDGEYTSDSTSISVSPSVAVSEVSPSLGRSVSSSTGSTQTEQPSVQFHTSTLSVSEELCSPSATLIPYTSCSPYIQVKHNLQICFKVSAPHPKNPGLRKQEDILIQIPIHLLSSKCTTDNLILPLYQATPPVLAC
ncbi:arrestin Aly1 related [Sugiyamaella lignohabitans]|uniref:Arrestin Aly1 related n=1 Tax=Sugiyamaella lignohabitans TaxID=796027 RepID=A0A161HJA0_9ASCO|nr:arrestin Aly1 related [Sugiyamaella lignohabitans]ANB12777.1 arrestin Aly1 related [Sugiyamaella lignohabitans]